MSTEIHTVSPIDALCVKAGIASCLECPLSDCNPKAFKAQKTTTRKDGKPKAYAVISRPNFIRQWCYVRDNVMEGKLTKPQGAELMGMNARTFYQMWQSPKWRSCVPDDATRQGDKVLISGLGREKGNNGLKLSV